MDGEDTASLEPSAEARQRRSPKPKTAGPKGPAVYSLQDRG